MKCKVCITKKDIQKATSAVDNCPIALAIRRRFPDTVCVSVQDNGLFFRRVNGGDTLITYDENNSLAIFIRDFDAGKKVKPFHFFIEYI